jgi:hypothetical protein
MKQLEGKIAVVTGASKGIGAGIAKMFAREGAKVVVNYSSDRTGAEKTLSEVTSSGGQGHIRQADITKADDASRLIAETVKRFNSLDIGEQRGHLYSLHDRRHGGKFFPANDDDQCVGPNTVAKIRAPAFSTSRCKCYKCQLASFTAFQCWNDSV